MRTFLGMEAPVRRRRRRRKAYDPSNGSLRRIKFALSELIIVIVCGSAGYLFFGFTPLEAIYQTVTTVATVGFREVNPLTAGGQIYTMVLIIVGAGSVLYNLGLLVEAITEGHLRTHLERRRMDNDISGLSGHVIVCGFGRVGRAAADNLASAGNDVVSIDRDPARFADGDVLHLVGDATDDELLREAGIERAHALIAALDSDAETVYLTLSARALRPDLVIVSRARTADSKAKLALAGATRAVNPQMIGGRRLAAFAMQPHVAEFLDVVLHDEDVDYRMQQLVVSAHQAASARTLADLDASALGVQILAVRTPSNAGFATNPPTTTVLTEGLVLIVMGAPEGIRKLAHRLAH